ncbi:MAG TPA: helix-turn-helix domain-containing protein [Candidatus Bilamarchaeaceae archaeon]|nr:helix-turn-helix domain-containing protein [Candidatus Bilamarchaeaceae archaeon]
MVRYNGEYCHFLSVLSNSYAFGISAALLEQGPLTKKELYEELGFHPNTIQKQLKNLMECGYVLPQSTKPIKYGVNKRIMLPLIKLMNFHIRRHGSRIRG